MKNIKILKILITDIYVIFHKVIKFDGTNYPHYFVVWQTRSVKTKLSSILVFIID